MKMAMQYSRSLLRVAIAQICQQLGWTAIQSTPLELLTNVLERYVLELGRQSRCYSELCTFFYLVVHLLTLDTNITFYTPADTSELWYWQEDWQMAHFHHHFGRPKIVICNPDIQQSGFNLQQCHW